MLTDVMDFDPRIISDGHGWFCNFHFGYGHDVIEDATNEKSCVQALRYLIANADAEIHDLEDELAMLQCQLKWAESDEQKDPYEVCCATFQRKINLLTKSINNMRNRNTLNEHNMDTTKIRAPAERIYDIISALIEQNFSAPDEQEKDMSNEMNLLVNSGSVDIGMEKETTSESCAESKGLSKDFERQYKPADTVSEESCSDTARYVIRDSSEARNIGKTDVEVTGKSKDDAYECTPAGKNGFLTCVQAYNNSGDSNSNVLHHGSFEECMTGSKNSGSSSSPVYSEIEVIVKVEEDYVDMSIHNVAADFLCKTQDHKSEDPVEGNQVVKENQSQSVVDNIHFTCERKKSSLGSILKPPRQKVQRKVSVIRQSDPSLMLKPQKKIGKRHINAANLRPSNSPSPLVKERTCSLPETIQQRQPGDIAHGNLPRLLGAKMREHQEASRQNSSIQFQEMKVSEEDDLCARRNLALKSQKELVIGLESPLLLDSSPANAHNVESKSTIAEDLETKVSPAYDFEYLRLKLSQDPDFLNKMRVPVLKEILKFYKVRGLSKFKKEKMIEELKMRLTDA